MKTTTTFRDMPPSTGLQQAAERWGTRLEQVYDSIMDCRVTIERMQRHSLHGASFQVQIALAVPGRNLAVPPQASKDVYVALGDAFRAVRRQLLDHVGRLGIVKAPPGGLHVSFVANKSS